jgi:hypothetical protein
MYLVIRARETRALKARFSMDGKVSMGRFSDVKIWSAVNAVAGERVRPKTCDFYRYIVIRQTVLITHACLPVCGEGMRSTRPRLE